MGMTGYSKYTIEDVRELLQQYGFELADDIYVNTNTLINFKDGEGYLYSLTFDKFKNSVIYMQSVPNRFHATNKHSIKNMCLWLQENKNNLELVSDEYTRCSKNYEFRCLTCLNHFEMSWNSISNGRGCPYCSGHRVSNLNSFVQKRPDLVLEWGYEDNDIDINSVSCGGSQIVWWICSRCGYKYKAKVADRVNGKHGCAACAGRVVTADNRLTEKFPSLAKEWDYDKNGSVAPEDVSFGSGKKVWWLCPKCSFSYASKVSNRVHGRGCPACASIDSESKIVLLLKTYAVERYNAIEEYDIFHNPLTNRKLPFDIYIPSCNLYVEVHGLQHYKFIPYFHKVLDKFEDSKYRDRIKKEFAETMGYFLEIDLRKVPKISDAISLLEDKIRTLEGLGYISQEEKAKE
jgi:hypothetical protein